MFVHSVYFWLRADLSEDDRARFGAGVADLLTIPDVRHGWVGTPADTDREVIDSSYSYGLLVVFDDVAGHDAYQVAPAHDRFRQQFAGFWDAVRIYDFETP